MGSPKTDFRQEYEDRIFEELAARTNGNEDDLEVAWSKSRELARLTFDYPRVVEGLATFRLRNYRMAVLPSMADVDDEEWQFDSLLFRFGPYQGHLVELDQDVILGKDTLHRGEHVIDLNHRGDVVFSAQSLRDFPKLTEFVENSPHLDWITFVTWLWAVGDGRLMSRYGLKVADVSLPRKARLGVETSALAHGISSATPRYRERLGHVDPKLVYASRQDFLQHWAKSSKLLSSVLQRR